MSSIDVLKKALAANGLPTSGNKEQMLQRLLSGEKDKRKKASPAANAKAAVVDTTKSDAEEDDVPEDDEAAVFAATTGASLRAEGHTDEDMIAAEVSRRWGKIKAKRSVDAVGNPAVNVKKASGKKRDDLDMNNGTPKPNAEPANEVHFFDAKLSDQHATMASLKFVTSTPEGFMYVKVKPTPPATKRQKKEPVIEHDDGQLSQAFIDKAMKVIAGRLLKKAGVNQMTPLLADFGVEIEETDKQSIVEALSQQLIYETDSDEDD